MKKNNFYLTIISLILAAHSYLDCGINQYIQRGKARRNELPAISKKFLDQELLIASTKKETSAQDIKNLIGNGADVNTKSYGSHGLAPLFWNITTNTNSTIDVDDHFYSEMTGCTPLHNACLCKNIHVVRELLKAGADVHLRNDLQCTPLHYIALSRNKNARHLLVTIQIAKLLLDNNAKILTKNSSSFLTPLDISIKTNKTYLTRLFYGTLFHQKSDIEYLKRCCPTFPSNIKEELPEYSFETIILELSGKQ